jgi:hypothetical protein
MYIIFNIYTRYINYSINLKYKYLFKRERENSKWENNDAETLEIE